MLEPKIACAVAILKKLISLLPKTSMPKLTLFSSLIHLHFVFGITVWDSTYPFCVKKLQISQNKANWIIVGANWNDLTLL